MRRPISIQVPRFDVDTVQPQIDEICGAFDRYLGMYRGRGSASKHALMGPVGKIISEIQHGRTDPASLKGYALHVHEAAERFPSLDAVVALDSGIDLLVELIARPDIPRTAHDIILDRIDHGVYYARRRHQIEQREQFNQAFRDHLRQQYGSLERLSAAWSEPVTTWDRVYAFGAQSQTYRRATETRRRDMDGFRELSRQRADAPVDDFEDEGVDA
ncbi:MAG: hypothetical protein IT305_18995 [Chloroflexi bacterium]|nr:hypothetical protein [Chloroflexota bacterium]